MSDPRTVVAEFLDAAEKDPRIRELLEPKVAEFGTGYEASVPDLEFEKSVSRVLENAQRHHKEALEEAENCNLTMAMLDFAMTFVADEDLPRPRNKGERELVARAKEDILRIWPETRFQVADLLKSHCGCR